MCQFMLIESCRVQLCNPPSVYYHELHDDHHDSVHTQALYAIDSSYSVAGAVVVSIVGAALRQ